MRKGVNIMHIERHLNKTNEELIIRLFKDWKLFSSCMSINVKHDFTVDGIYIIHTEDIAGFGYNRRYEKVITYSYKVVVKYGNIITVYPDLENGILTGEYFDFSKINYGTELWRMFTDVVYQVPYEVRYIDKKNPQLRVYFDDSVLKINKNYGAILVENINEYVKKEKAVEGEIRSSDDILKFIKNAKKKESCFRLNLCN